MIPFKSIALAATVLVASGVLATAAQAAENATTADARVLKSLTITNASKLDFGTIVSGPTAGTVVISAAGARTCSGVTCSKTSTAAAFDVTGSKSQIVNVTWDNTVTLTNGTTTMTATLMTNPGTQRTLDAAAGKATFAVGGSLAVAANQADGVYSGPFKVYVDYN